MTNDTTPYDRIEALERRAVDLERRFTEAFPAGDHLSHRQYHEMMMEESRDRKKLIAAVKEKTIAGLVWGMMLATGAACWTYFLKLVRGE